MREDFKQCCGLLLDQMLEKELRLLHRSEKQPRQKKHPSHVLQQIRQSCITGSDVTELRNRAERQDQ